MLMRYRAVPLQPWNARSPRSVDACRKEHDGDDVDAIIQTVRDASRYRTVYTLELYSRDRLDTLDVALTFNALKDLPHLQDLAIDFDTVVFPRHPRELPLLSFRPRRLVVCPLFPGAAHLLRCAGETLECLVLGDLSDERFSHAQLVGDLSRFVNLRALRIQTAPDARFLASATLRVTALAVPYSGLDLACRGLTSLSVIYSQLDDNNARPLAAALSQFPALRKLEIERDTRDGTAPVAHPDTTVLEDVCHARGIFFSVIEMRLPGRWEKLDWQ